MDSDSITISVDVFTVFLMMKIGKLWLNKQNYLLFKSQCVEHWEKESWKGWDTIYHANNNQKKIVATIIPVKFSFKAITITRDEEVNSVWTFSLPGR